jgi:hypothetical protein
MDYEINVIVPLGFSKFLKNSIDNFTRQSYYKKKLIIVENNNGIGACKEYGFIPDILLESEPHVSYAKNTAILKIKNGFWTTFDADDYYGENYLSELAKYIKKADIIGKSDIFVKTTEDKLRLMKGIGHNKYVKFINGPTISSWAENKLLFNPISPWGEDCDWIERAIKLRMNIYSTSYNNFCYMRYKTHNHTWQVSDYQMSQLFYFTADDKAKIIEFDDINYNLINGKIKIEDIKYKLIEKQPFDDTDNPLVAFAKKSMTSFEDWINSIKQN